MWATQCHKPSSWGWFYTTRKNCDFGFVSCVYIYIYRYIGPIGFISLLVLINRIHHFPFLFKGTANFATEWSDWAPPTNEMCFPSCKTTKSHAFKCSSWTISHFLLVESICYICLMIKVPNLHFPHLALGTAAVWGTSCVNKVGPNGQTKHQSKAAATCCFCFWKTTWLMNPADETIWVNPPQFLCESRMSDRWNHGWIHHVSCGKRRESHGRHNWVFWNMEIFTCKISPYVHIQHWFMITIFMTSQQTPDFGREIPLLIVD